MSSRSSAGGVEQWRVRFRAESDKVFEAMSGQDGANGSVTFEPRERRACQQTDPLARGFYDAPVRGLPGDGGNWIVPPGPLHFDGWRLVPDVVHLVGRLFEAATASYRRDAQRAWELYLRWLGQAWEGQVRQPPASMHPRLQRLGGLPVDAATTDPRRIQARAIG